MKECELIKEGHTFGLLAETLFCPDLVYIYTFFYYFVVYSQYTPLKSPL